MGLFGVAKEEQTARVRRMNLHGEDESFAEICSYVSASLSRSLSCCLLMHAQAHYWLANL